MFGLSSLLELIHDQLSMTHTGWCDELYHCHLKFRQLDAVSSREFVQQAKRGIFYLGVSPKCPTTP